MRVQTVIAGSGTAPAIAARRRIAKDLDYLTARIHALRSRMAEAERLDGLCRIGSLPEFYLTIFPEHEFKGNLDFQRRLVNELIDELSVLSSRMSGPGANLIDWTLVRFQVENLKVLIRACLARTPVEGLYGHLVPLPRELALDQEGLAAAPSLEDFVRLVPKGFPRDNLEKALKIYPDNPRPFFFEAALDRGYFQGLLAGTERLSQEDRGIVGPMVYQEVDIFHLMVVARGKFYYNLMSEMLQPLHVAGSRISRALFIAMLNDQDIYTAAGRAARRVLDAAPFEEAPKDGSKAINASTLESLAWKRFFRLANLAFRQSHMGLGAIMGYVGLRRVEVANLITISEGIRSNMAAETISGRLIQRGVYV
jgi:vacuolar-type H+-ATPase subunit C/Vma6